MHSHNSSEQMGIFYTKSRNSILKHNHLLVHAGTENSDFIMVNESWLNTHDKHLIVEAEVGILYSKNSAYTRINEASSYM